MKKLYFLFFLVFGLYAYAQNPNDIVYIPDLAFKHKLLNSNTSLPFATDFNDNNVAVDINNDGQIQVSEALLIKKLDVNGSYGPNIEHISDFTGIEAFVNLESLKCSFNFLTILNISNLIHLKELVCDYNQLTSLNISTLTNLEKLNCAFNSQVGLINFSGLSYLKDVNISGIGLLELPDLSSLVNLEILNCSYNSLSNIDLTAFSSLHSLACYNNQLTSLNIDGLDFTNIACGNNPQLPSINFNNFINLINLDCSGNILQGTLDLSNCSQLQTLNCSNSNLSELLLSDSANLLMLDCSNNNLTTLFINGITYNFIFEFIFGIHFYNNPSLTYICVGDSMVDYIQNIINQYGYNNTCLVNTYCSFVPGGTYYIVQGNTRFDSYNNGCDDDNNNNLPNQSFAISDGTNNGILIANTTGAYSIPFQSGSHTVTPVFENSNYFTASPNSVTVSFPTATSPYTQNFCITANGVKNDLEVTVIPVSVARPGFDAEYKIIYKNKGNQVANGSLSFTFNDAIMDLVSAIPVNDALTTNSLSWNYTNLNSFETREIDLVFNINSPMETPAVNGGDILHYTANIVGATDETPNDNTFTLNQTVVNSYDPNDKTCLEGATITPSMVGQYVHYVIRFENTGTYPAENIVVKDMIDTAKFDIATLVPQRASHDFYTRINGNKVEFIFENINLPFDDANNDGYVAFKIKTKPTLVLGNTFTNSASIYFDYNFPIVTDPATTTVAALGNQDFDFATYFTLYPNPAKDILNLEIKNEIGVKSVSVYNTLGQIVIAITNVDNLKDIDVSSLTAGSYFVKVYTDKGNAVSKFIKQ